MDKTPTTGYAQLYDRNQEIIAPLDPNAVNPPDVSNIDYSQFGLLPNVAQNVQNTPQVAPNLFPQSYFSQATANVAQWFTTRVHLSPLGSITNE